MGIEVKGGGSLAVAVLAVGFMLTVAVGLGIPEIHGFSFGWGWRGVNSGRTVVRALTPKIQDVRVRGIYLAEGEQLVATYDFRLEDGRARLFISRRGWIPRARDSQLLYRDLDIRQSVRKEVRLAAPRDGFYSVSGTIVRATGEFAIEWRVEQTQTRAHALRLARAGLGFAPLLLVGLLLVVLVVAGVRALAD